MSPATITKNPAATGRPDTSENGAFPADQDCNIESMNLGRKKCLTCTYHLGSGRRAAKMSLGAVIPEAGVTTSNLRLKSENLNPVLEALSLVIKITLHIHCL